MIPIDIQLFNGIINGASTQDTRLLLDQGADPNAVISDSVLMTAVRVDRDDIVRILVQEYGAHVNVRDASGQTALMYAISNGSIHLARFLIKKRADVNVRDTSGQTALICAAQRDSFIIAELLIEKGADVNAHTNEWKTALMYATQKRKSNLQLTKLLIEKGADVNVRDTSGQTVLMYAARKGDIKKVKLLIEKGADVNVRDTSGQTAEDYARLNGYNDIVKLFRMIETNVVMSEFQRTELGSRLDPDSRMKIASHIAQRPVVGLDTQLHSVTIRSQSQVSTKALGDMMT